MPDYLADLEAIGQRLLDLPITDARQDLFDALEDLARAAKAREDV